MTLLETFRGTGRERRFAVAPRIGESKTPGSDPTVVFD